jgi:hypothetical protein
MPRKAPTDVIEHRISLGEYERKRLDEFASAYNRDKWLENIPELLQGTGVVLVGGGLVWGAYGFWTWLTGEKIIHKFFKATNSVLDNVAGDISEAFFGYDEVEHIRQRQALNDEFDEIASRIDLYCSTGSSEYDRAKCTQAYEERAVWEQKRDALKVQQETEKQQKKDQKMIGYMIDETVEDFSSWENFKKSVSESLLNPATWFD